jgi:hypothetical protein
VSTAGNKNGNSKSLQTASFLDFTTTTAQYAPAMEKKKNQCIHRIKLDFLKLCGQYYDGASSTSDVYTGRENGIGSRQRALYVNCVSHNVNRVPSNTIMAIPQVMDYFPTVEGRYNFYNGSVKGWETFPLPPSSLKISIRSYVLQSVQHRLAIATYRCL